MGRKLWYVKRIDKIIQANEQNSYVCGKITVLKDVSIIRLSTNDQ